MFGFEHGGAEHQLHQRAGAADDVGPVSVADGAQGGDGIAHAQVVGRLVGGLLRLNGGQVGQGVAQPNLDGRQVAVCVACVNTVLQPLRHLRQEHAADTALRQRREQAVQRLRGVVLDVVTAQIGQLARCLVGGNALGQAAQVLDQHHTQRGGQGPHLAQVQLARLLVGTQELRQQFLVERAVCVGNKSPRHAVHARQARERFVQEHGQRAKVAARQALVDLLELRFDQVEVVEQPLGRRADVVARRGLCAYVAVRFAQRADVAAQARKEGCLARQRPFGTVRLAEAAAVLRKTLRAEDLGADRRFERAARSVENVAQGPGCGRYQAQQLVVRHAVKSPATRHP